ncbi:hypothetical protein Ancab_011845 [Ancistrocladus abbreviatus]
MLGLWNNCSITFDSVKKYNLLNHRLTDAAELQVMLSNMHAAAGRWHDVSKVRKRAA